MLLGRFYDIANHGLPLGHGKHEFLSIARVFQMFLLDESSTKSA